jgi:hypothetical protein
MKKIVLWAFLVLSTAGRLLAEVVSAHASVDSTKYAVGDWITVHIELSHPRGYAFQSLLGDTINGFHVIQRPSLQGSEDTITSTTLVVAKYDSGTSVLPGLPFRYSASGDTAVQTIATNPLLLTISTVAVDTSREIKDVKPPLSIPLSIAEIALYAAIVLLMAGAVYLWYRYWKKKQQKQSGQVYVPPPKAAHLVALEELAILKEKKLWQQGLIKQYYSEATEIIRRYIENRFGLMALEKTTDEILLGLKSHRIAGDIIAETETILCRADLVKFAKYQPGIPEHEEMLTIALDIVDKTKVVQMTAPAQTAPTLPVEA